MSTFGTMPLRTRPAIRTPKAFALALVVLAACWFVGRYVVHYYLHYSPAELGEYWPRRDWLLMHITCGMLALLIGPWQFSTRLRQRYLKLHRVMGRVYLISVVFGALAALDLAFTTTLGRPWGLGLAALALAWLTTSGMAFYAIRQRQIQIHREWMIRSYIVTFAFVTFRFLEHTPPFSSLSPLPERAITYLWASWVIPLLVAEVILNLRRMQTHRVPATQS